MAGDFSVIVDPYIWKQRKKEEEAASTWERSQHHHANTEEKWKVEKLSF